VKIFRNVSRNRGSVWIMAANWRDGGIGCGRNPFTRCVHNTFLNSRVYTARENPLPPPGPGYYIYIIAETRPRHSACLYICICVYMINNKLNAPRSAVFELRGSVTRYCHTHVRFQSILCIYIIRINRTVVDLCERPPQC